MRYKHIVFDVDGTLIDSEKNDIRSLQSTLRDLLGQERTYQELCTVFGAVGRQELANLGYSLAEVEKIYPAWYARSAETIGDAPLFAGMEDVLLSLRGQEHSMGVVTSRQREMYQLGAVTHRLERFFPITICLEDTVQHKPEPAPLLEYLRRAGATAEQTLFVGDSPYDMKCAAAAGVDSALARWGAQDQNLPATHYLEAPAELLRLL